MFFFIYLIRQLELETFIIVGEQIRKKNLKCSKVNIKGFFFKQILQKALK